MDRRTFVVGTGAVLLAAPLAAEAQQARVYRVGVVLQGGPYLGTVDGLRKGLAELGLEEAKQVILHLLQRRSEGSGAGGGGPRTGESRPDICRRQLGDACGQARY